MGVTAGAAGTVAPAMAQATIASRELDLSELEGIVGSRSYERGLEYARRGRVLRLGWDAEAEALTGAVVGRGGLYETAAFFYADPGGMLVFEGGRCSCPIGLDCKHVAALALAATQRRLPARPDEAPQLPSWERPLRALIDEPSAGTAGNPLAVELTLATPHGAVPRLEARLLRPGARGGWVNGSLNWSLDAWHIRKDQLREDHVELARELCALQRAGAANTPYWYGYGDKTIDLSDCGPHLWALLDEAARLGLVLVSASRTHGELAPYERGEVVLDVTSPDEKGSLVRALLRTGSELEPVRFLGKSGHGVACLDRSDHVRLVRLARAVPSKLQRLVLDSSALSIPASDLSRFAEELSPALVRLAPVVSSDESFAPPEVSPPSLTLRVSFGTGHAVEAGWGWAYEVGDSVHVVPLRPAAGAGAGFRDLGAERTEIAGLDLSGSGLEAYGLLDASGRPSAGSVLLHGLESMRFATEQLPLVGDVAGLELEGEPPDFRDVGESLAIGVSTAEVAGERDWFDLGVTISVEGREVPFAEVFAALAAGETHLLLPDGAHFSLLDPRLQSLRQLIEEAAGLTDAVATSTRISRYQATLWSELVALGIVTSQAQGWQRQVEALLDVDTLAVHDPPPTLDAELRPYQREGFAWLATLWELGLGGILADDMGLGKTLQTLALVCHARERDPALGPFLVVAPTSVVSNWAREAARFAPGLSVAPVTDTLAKSGGSIEELAAADVVVTTYTLLRLDAGAYGSVEWAGVVLDEAQFVKNHQAKTYRCVRELSAPFKLALTGTPMENNLTELWSLLSITAPGLFPDPKRFAEQYARPIEREGDRERLARLRRRIKPLVKRRTKELVAADLPAKQEQTLLVDLHPRHRKLYDTHLQRERRKILGLLADFDRNRFTILQSITLLRQLSLHPGLADPDSGSLPCAKLDGLVEQLEDVIGGDHRALVFSQFTGFLARVRDRLDEEGVGYCYLDGRTRQRERVLDRFRAGDDPVFLISLKAGGVGLNLTEADYCFLLDPWWNPATENQAIDRTHRIGQTRHVMVYRLIARDTIEEKVVALAQRKAELFRGVMDDGDLFATSLTAEDIRGLLD